MVEKIRLSSILSSASAFNSPKKLQKKNAIMNVNATFSNTPTMKIVTSKITVYEILSTVNTLSFLSDKLWRHMFTCSRQEYYGSTAKIKSIDPILDLLFFKNSWDLFQTKFFSMLPSSSTNILSFLYHILG